MMAHRYVGGTIQAQDRKTRRENLRNKINRVHAVFLRVLVHSVRSQARAAGMSVKEIKGHMEASLKRQHFGYWIALCRNHKPAMLSALNCL